MPIRILIADDHAVLRAGLRMLLNAEADMTVVGEASDGTSAIEMVKTFEPDVVLMDITMPGMNGLEATERILRVRPSTRVLVLTMHDDIGYLRQLFEAGAMGYVVKRAADQELVTAIRAVHSGERFVDSSLAGKVAAALWGKREISRQSDTDSPLSEREREVLLHIAKGYTNKETAQELRISVKTVETYRMRLMQKLGLQTRAELVRYAMKESLLGEK